MNQSNNLTNKNNKLLAINIYHKGVTYAYYIPKSKSPKAINVLQRYLKIKQVPTLPGAIYMTTKMVK